MRTLQINAASGRFRLIPSIILLMFIAGAVQFTSGSWIWAKAWLAQELLEHSWQQLQISGVEKKPWPWADTHATARLQVAELGVDQIVLAGDSGRTLAFGPGHSSQSASPGSPGLTIVSGHRDTHFRFLQQLQHDAVISLQTRQGLFRYRVTGRDIVDSRQVEIQDTLLQHRLLLITCYPFDSLESGGPLRYLVWADPEPATGLLTANHL